MNVITAPGPNVELDVETLQWLVWRTGGDVLHLPSFSGACAPKITQHLTHWAGKMQGSAYDCVVKIRCSKGLKCSELLAPWPAAKGSDNSAFELPRISADTSFVFSLKLEDCEDEDYTWTSYYVQLAVLYTNVRGERLLRIHTTAIPVANSIKMVYQHANVGPLMALLVRRAAITTQQKQSGDATRAQRDCLLEFLLQVLKHYHRHCYRSECGDCAVAISKRLNLLPLYILGARKLMYSVEGMGPLRQEFHERLLRMPTHSLLVALYPRVYPIAAEEDNSANEGDITCSTADPDAIPAPIAPIQDSMAKGVWPAYLVVNGLSAWMFLKPSCKSDGDTAHENKFHIDNPVSLRSAAASVCTQVREALEPTPTSLPMLDLKIGSAVDMTRNHKIFLGSLFVEDECLAELAYPEWILYLHDQLKARRVG